MITVGILGGGQLGRMLALAGYPLGLGFRFLDPDPEAPAGQVADHVIAGFEDALSVESFAADLDVVTYEFENVPVQLAQALEQQLPVFPPPAALQASQDRLTEKTLFRRLSVPTAPFAAIDNASDLDRAAAEFGYPCLLKTRRFGYDGKGQYLLQGPDDLKPAITALGRQPLILEGFVRFDREVSLLAVRARDGTMAFYPLVENHHADGILRLSLAPAPGLQAALQSRAEAHVRGVLEELGYVGVLAVEFFEQNGQLIANEMAPRVHNSGHWTIEAAATSQFENHLRAILGLPLGSTAVAQPCAMINLIGTVPATKDVLAVPDTHLHLYGKTPRPGRKLGHITARAATEALLQEKLARLRALPEK
jgi:5-(carboxyamino)imidazole ribonucleotide synthase